MSANSGGIWEADYHEEYDNIDSYIV
jgi:hypothetical protein